MPVRPGTISSTLATIAAQSAARTILPGRVAASSAACASRKAANAMNTLCVMWALNATGSSGTPLSHPLAGKHAQPEQIGQHERHEHGREKGGDAALAPDRLPQEEYQRRDQQQPRCLRQRLEHVPGSADRIKGSQEVQDVQRERQQGDRIAANGRELVPVLAAGNPEEQDEPEQDVVERDRHRDGKSQQDRRPFHGVLGALVRRARPRGRRRWAKAGGTFHETAVEHQGEGGEESRRHGRAARNHDYIGGPGGERRLPEDIPPHGARPDTGIMSGHGSVAKGTFPVCGRPGRGDVPKRRRNPRPMQDLPLAVLVATVSSYWIGVGVMIARVRRHTRKVVGLVPEQRLERLMWLVWVPLVAAWIFVPWATLTRSGAVPALPDFALRRARCSPRCAGSPRSSP